MNSGIAELMQAWEHCPDCGALLFNTPGSLYCSHCGFEELVFDESPAFFPQRAPRYHEETVPEDEPQVAAA